MLINIDTDGFPKNAAAVNGLHNSIPYKNLIGSKAKTACARSFLVQVPE